MRNNHHLSSRFCKVELDSNTRCNIVPKSILNSSVGHLCLSCSRRVALSVKGRIGSHLNCGHPFPTLVVTISHGKSGIVEVSHCNYSPQEKGSVLKSFIGQRQCQYRIHEWKIILTLQVDFVSLSQDQIHIITWYQSLFQTHQWTIHVYHALGR